MNPYLEAPGVTLFHGDCLDVLRELPDESVHAVVTDPPYGLEFMGRAWDSFKPAGKISQIGEGDGTPFRRSAGTPAWGASGNPSCVNCGGQKYGRGKPCTCDRPEFPNHMAGQMHTFQDWCTQWAAECRRVLKPGGHLLAFGGSRTWHRLAAGVEDAGFEMRDSIAWLYASGFPKSLNVARDARFCQCAQGGSTHGDGEVRGVREAVRDLAADAQEGEESDLLTAVQREGSGSRLGRDRAHRSEGEDASALHLRSGEAAGRAEPVVEGRSDAEAGARELPGRDVHAVSGGVPVDGARGWVRDDASLGDGAVDRASVDPDGSRSSSRSRPGAQRSVEPRALADERGSQAGGVWPTCGVCGKPQVDGWGTALKPAFEPIVVARKPLAGTVAANVLAHGTGALNVGANRVGSEQRTNVPAGASTNTSVSIGDGWKAEASARSVEGRWPANVVLDESQAAELDRQAPDTGGSGRASGPSLTGTTVASAAYGARNGVDSTPFYGDRGGASRMFPTFRYEAKAPTFERPVVDGVAHPTVKPLDLMRWLVRLVTPKGGTVLEPFAGSGTTVEACLREGFDVIAIEREAEYLPLIEKRIRKDHAQGLDFDWGGAA